MPRALHSRTLFAALNVFTPEAALAAVRGRPAAEYSSFSYRVRLASLCCGLVIPLVAFATCTGTAVAEPISPSVPAHASAGTLVAPAAKPKNTALPVISGQAVVGDTLTSSTGTWANAPSAYQYNWRRCDTSGTNCTRITGLQPSNNYTLVSGDQGHTIDVNVQACNASGCVVKTSNPTAVVQPASQPPGSGLLVGDQALEPTTDSNGDGGAQAWSYTARASGTASGVQVYTGTGNSGALSVGIYSDSNGRPGTLLASTSVPNTQGQWDQATFTNGPNIINGTKYWLALLGTGGGSFAYRDNSAGSCTTVGTIGGLSALPSSWSTDWTATGFCPASIYVTGAGGGGSVAPSNTALPTISGTPQQGDTLTVSNGSWSGDTPMSFAYQWQDCNSSGASCANISGATSSSYRLQASDVGSTIRSVVTATNAGGSTSASSRVTSVVASGGGGGGSVPCALTVAAASCWQQNTGVQGATGVTETQIESNPAAYGFKHVTQNVNVTQPNVTIDHEWISGCVAIQATATNFHMTDSLVTSYSQDCQNNSSDSNPGVVVDGNTQNVPSGVVIQDSTIDAQSINLEQNPIVNDFGVVLGAGSLALRDNIFGYAKDIFLNGQPGAVTTLQDSYVHDPPAPAVDTYDCGGPGDSKYDPHSDPVWVDGSEYVTLEHDWVSGAGGGDCVTSAVSFLGVDFGHPNHDKVDSTFMDGGLAPGGGRPDAYFGKLTDCATNLTVTNDAFSSQAGYNGPTTDPNQLVLEYAPGSSNTWSGNTIAESGSTMAQPNDCG